MLGSFQSLDPYQAHNIDFTVPATAQLGSTILRVRGVYLLGSEPQPIDVCFNYSYGETEDYAVVIDGNIPQDCVGADNGPALPGTPCDDGNSSTADDMYDANCLCVGQLTTAVADGAGTPMRFTVQPNPSTGMFQLNNPRQVLARMEVRDALGRLVVAETTVTSRKATFDLSTVPTGLYHLLVESEGRRDVIESRCSAELFRSTLRSRVGLRWKAHPVPFGTVRMSRLQGPWSRCHFERWWRHSDRA